MTPDRFTAFSGDQADQLAHELDNLWKRAAMLIAILAVGGALGFGWALKGIHDASDRGDRASARAAAVNRRLIHDANQRAADSRAQAEASAKAAYAACRRQQESVVVSREFFAVLRPALVAHNPPWLVHKLFHDIDAQHSLEIPKCQKPPKGS